MLLDWIPTKRLPEPDVESASPALLKRRAYATLIDLVVCYLVVETAILAVLMVVYTDFFVERPEVAFRLSVVGLVPVYLLYTFSFEWRYARTPGKQRMELLVTTPEGTGPSLTEAAVRNVFRYVDWLPIGYVLGWVLARRSARGRRLGDVVAGTIVVRPETEAEPLMDPDREPAFHTDSETDRSGDTE